MVSMKFSVLFAFLAIGAFQCQGATVQQPEPLELDIFVAIDNIIKVVKHIVEAVNSGIKNSSPNIDALIKELTPELGKVVEQIRKDSLEAVDKVEARIDIIIKGVETLLKAIKGIKTCTDPQQQNIRKAIAGIENGLLKVVQEILKKHSSDVKDLEDGFMGLLERLRTLYDKEMAAVTACVKPKHPNMKKCIDDELQKILKDLLALGTDAVLFISELADTAIPIGAEIAQQGLPEIEKFMKAIEPSMKQISECVAKMS